MKKLVYPVLFQKNAEGYVITIPDIKQTVHAGNFDEGVCIAEELLGLWLAFLLDNGESLPLAASSLYKLPEGALVYEIEAHIDKYRNKYKDYLKGDDEDE